jgi:hypothetical protein
LDFYPHGEEFPIGGSSSLYCELSARDGGAQSLRGIIDGPNSQHDREVFKWIEARYSHLETPGSPSGVRYIPAHSATPVLSIRGKERSLELLLSYECIDRDGKGVPLHLCSGVKLPSARFDDISAEGVSRKLVRELTLPSECRAREEAHAVKASSATHSKAPGSVAVGAGSNGASSASAAGRSSAGK